ncbi:glycerol-3-phosphate dehydrogenase/oxidase [Maridesulfovibrio bastinii]|uniref:glycerol-3-phosphate dehydrogenase/oxidase n=1 Tax=Maridesulfovibrio bastinii TaxID=47157 RepID=UPI00041DB047|nr:glycerol-3-phosphate dehydrogenase/oxidase [Maridesulfovibrio bastinii]
MKRSNFVQQMEDSSKEWDFIIIGGGATGLGSGLDAAARGYSVLLLEQGDFAEATSSRSTKMVHGGVRYLAQGNISLVMEALYERGVLRQNAPHMCYNQKFIVPDYKWWGLPYYGIGLKMYDMLSRKYTFGKSQIFTASKVSKEVPKVLRCGLKGGVTYHDGQFDDARLAVTLAQTMSDLGGCPVNYTKVTGLIKNSSGYVCGVNAEDKISGKTYELKAKAVINATGIFTDDIMNMDNLEHKKLIAPSQGIHIVIDREFLGGNTGIMVPKTDDGRVIFFVPWHGKVVVGTTDTPLSKVSMHPKPLDEEIDFLIEHSARYLATPPTKADIRSVFVGIRPLVAAGEAEKTSKLSRDHFLTVSPNKLLTIAGGKWTTYRHMAEDCIDHAIEMGGLTFRPTPTKNLKLHGYTETYDHNDHMHVYGSEAAEIKALATELPELDTQMHEDLPYSWLEVVWACRNESVQTVADALARRTRALILDARATAEVAPKAAEIIARELGKDKNWIESQIEDFTKLAENYIVN